MIKATKAPPASSNEARIQLRVTNADRVRLNVLRAKREQTMQGLIREALNAWLVKEGEKPLQEITS